MKPYLDLVRTILDTGSWDDNRTGIRTLTIPGAMMRLDLAEGFPALTTKKLAFKSVVGELVGFRRATQSAADFRALGCKVWDQNANENTEWLANPYRMEQEDFLGPVYGVQWRQWPGYKLLDVGATKQIADAQRRGWRVVSMVQDEGQDKVLLHKAIDQLRECMDTIMNNPGSRRILFYAWNPAVLDEVALPACHLLYQLIPNPTTRELHLCLYLRSNDIELGTGFNLASGAALLHLIGRLTGYKPRFFTYFVGSAHIYENHLDMLHERIQREPYPLSKLVLSDRIPDYAVTGKYEPEWLEKVEPSDFALEGYRHHAPLSAPMAV